VLSWLTSTSPVPSPPPSTTSTSATPYVSMTFNPTTSLFSTTSGPKSLVSALGGPLTPKCHDTQGNILRPVPLRSRFFHAENSVKPSFKPWFDDDKENYIDQTGMFEKSDGRTFGKMFGIEKDEKICLRCYDKSAFILEPCNHTYSLFQCFNVVCARSV
jgi:hypothetical protein